VAIRKELGTPLASEKVGWSHSSDNTTWEYHRHYKGRTETPRGQAAETAVDRNEVGKMQSVYIQGAGVTHRGLTTMQPG